jgi:hypothetical protein
MYIKWDNTSKIILHSAWHIVSALGNDNWQLLSYEIEWKTRSKDRIIDEPK